MNEPDANGTNGPVRVPPEVMEGLDAIRCSGLTHMLDRPTVARIAARMGHPETVR